MVSNQDENNNIVVIYMWNIYRQGKIKEQWSELSSLIFSGKKKKVYQSDVCTSCAYLTLLLLNMTCPVLANSVDPDQLASDLDLHCLSLYMGISIKNLDQVI